MRCVKELMKDHYLKYASYVILDRAIPDLSDGLKPVQRRILHTLFKAHDGKFHKVANIVGQTMAYHPHGDAPIYEALVGVANKGFLLDCQGNFGNIYTGDPAAAARYIETRLSKLSLDTMFNPDLTKYVPSYDGRNVEPVSLPAKIPLLLMQGADGIAVGMATKIFPHNFQELIKAQISILKGKTASLYPDFPTGGMMDVSEYVDGKGKIRLRAVLEEKNAKTILIKQICYSTTTESLINSIEDAAKKGKIKIESIHDYTADRVEIEITLLRGTYAKDVIDQLYAFTECEVVLTAQQIVIEDDTPREMETSQIVSYYTQKLQEYLRREYEIQLKETQELLLARTLERIFIEEKMYRKLETADTLEQVMRMFKESFLPYHKELFRVPTEADFTNLLKIPIRKIARFDVEENKKVCIELKKQEEETVEILQNIPKQAILYLEGLLKKYGALFPRKTVIQDLEQVDRREMERKEIDLFYDKKAGYVGTKISGEKIRCTNMDKILVVLSDGSYKIISVTDRIYVAKAGAEISFCGVADKQQVLTCCYRDTNTGLSFIKRFVVKQYILDREYRYVEEHCEVLVITPVEGSLFIQLVPKSRQRVAAFDVAIGNFPVKGVSAHGIRLSPRPVLSVEHR